MERNVSVYPFPFGTRVFMHRDGVIREAEYRGMKIKDTSFLSINKINIQFKNISLS